LGARFSKQKQYQPEETSPIALARVISSGCMHVQGEPISIKPKIKTSQSYYPGGQVGF